MYKTAFNATNVAVVVSEDGRTIGGHEWGTVDTTDAVSRRLLDAGTLLEASAPEDATTANQAAVAAFNRTETVTARADQARGLDKDQLHETAVQAGLVDADDSARKNDLVDAVAEATNVDVPAPSKKSRTRRNQQEA